MRPPLLLDPWCWIIAEPLRQRVVVVIRRVVEVVRLGVAPDKAAVPARAFDPHVSPRCSVIAGAAYLTDGWRGLGRI